MFPINVCFHLANCSHVEHVSFFYQFVVQKFYRPSWLFTGFFWRVVWRFAWWLKQSSVSLSAKRRLYGLIVKIPSVSHLLSCWCGSEEQIVRRVLPANHGLLAARHFSHRGNFSYEKIIVECFLSKITKDTHFLPWAWPGWRCILSPDVCRPENDHHECSEMTLE